MLTDLTAAVLMVLVELALCHLEICHCQSEFVETCCAADGSVS